MTIRKGEDWGSRAELPIDAPIVDSDAALAELFTVKGDVVSGPRQVGLTAGDMARTLGARGSAFSLRSGERTILPIDLGIVQVDGRTMVMVSSLIIRRRLWVGVVEGAMNASFLGNWNTTPSGHPNDGRFDTFRAELTLADRMKARTRLRLGTHVPHPNIQIRRLRSGTFAPDRRSRVWVDGVCLGSAEDVRFAVHPDAVQVVI